MKIGTSNLKQIGIEILRWFFLMLYAAALAAILFFARPFGTLRADILFFIRNREAVLQKYEPVEGPPVLEKPVSRFDWEYYRSDFNFSSSQTESDESKKP